MTSLTKELVENILLAAVKAPSGDNVQPFRFDVSADLRCVDVYNVPERDLSYFNYQQYASFVAHGALIENVMVAARFHGVRVELEMFPTADNEEHVARFSLSESESEPEAKPLYDAIFTRCTNRNMYHKGAFTAEQKSALMRAVEGIDGVELSLVDDVKQKNSLAQQLAVNDRMVFEHPEIHAFLFKQVRWSAQEVQDKKDGMPTGTLGLNPVEKILFPLMRYWSFVKVANVFGLSRVIGIKGWLGCRSAMALGMVTTSLPGRSGFLASGRVLQRVWLEATRQGMAFQPVTGITFLMQRIKMNELDGFNAGQSQLIARTESAMRHYFNTGDNTMAVGFRVGYSQPPEAKTERMIPTITYKKS